MPDMHEFRQDVDAIRMRRQSSLEALIGRRKLLSRGNYGFLLMVLVPVLDFCAAFPAVEWATVWHKETAETVAGSAGPGFAAGVLFVTIANLGRLYSLSTLSRMPRQMLATAAIWLVTCALLVVIARLLGAPSPWGSYSWGLKVAALGLLMLLSLHFLIALVFRIGRRHGYFIRRVAVIGGSGDAALRYLSAHNSATARDEIIVGIFDDRHTRIPEKVEGFPVIGDVQALVDYAKDHVVDLVFITVPWANDPRNRQLVEQLQELPLDIVIALDLRSENDVLVPRRLHRMGPVPAIQVIERPLDDRERVLKRLEDYVVALTALILLSPIMIATAILIKATSRGPVLFSQERFGFKNQRIQVLKFRSMYVDRGDVSGRRRTVKGDDRVTPVGRFIRRFSIDELPQLINVLRGEMSVVGPRAHAVAMTVGTQYYYDAVKTYVSRHRVKPGLTGWAQVNGSRGPVITLDQAETRLRYDLEYVNNWSLWMDIRIMVRTAALVLFDKQAF